MLKFSGKTKQKELIYNRLGNTDLLVSRLGFGLMRLPVSATNPDFTSSIQLIRGAIQLGINFFDVGTFYCQDQCETAFSRALTPGLSKKAVFSGKNSSHQMKIHSWSDQLTRTLQIFGRDMLDIYFLHYLDLKTWNDYYLKNGVIDQVTEAGKKGCFRYIGFSSHDSPENIKSIIDSHFFDAVILQYNLLETENRSVIHYAGQKGLGVIIMNPLAGGLLAGQNDFLTEEITGLSGLKYNALKFVFSNPDVHCVLSGMRNIPEMKENISILEGTETKTGDFEKVISCIQTMETDNRTHCTDCRYCLPCPQGINIPEIIRLHNKYRLFRKKLYSREYSLLESNAGCCIGCGICEAQCPNGIPIMSVMKESVDKYLD